MAKNSTLGEALTEGLEEARAWKRGDVGLDTDIIAAGKPIPRIASAIPLADRMVQIRWKGGSSKIVDLTSPFASKSVFASLRADDKLFRTLQVSDFGDALAWGGPDLEFPASWLDRLPDETR
ncbi:hypothetical protein ACR8FJ_22475 [Salmonella enterica subsp. enterica serovar Paratyphi A]